MSTARPFPSEPAALLLDLDGTLADTEALHWKSALAVMAEVGLDADAFPPVPPAGWSERRFWLDLHARTPLRTPIATLVERRSDHLVAMLRSRSLEPRPGVVATLREAEERAIPRLVVSGSPRRQIEAILTAAGLRTWIPGWISTCDDTRYEKPHPEGYRLAAERLGVPVAACVALEDTLVGARAARAAGAFTVLVPSTPLPAEPIEVDLLLESLEHLPFPRMR